MGLRIFQEVLSTYLLPDLINLCFSYCERKDLLVGKWVMEYDEDDVPPTYDIAISPCGEVYLVDKLDRRVRIYTSDGIFLRQFGRENLEAPFQIAISPCGRIFLVDHAQKDFYLKIFDLNGRMIRVKKLRKIASIAGITIDSLRKEIYLADNARIQIKVYSFRGKFLRTWKEPFDSLKDIFYDSNKIYTISYDCLRICSREGKSSKELTRSTGESERFDNICSLSILDDEVFVAACYANQIQVFSRAGKLLRKFGSLDPESDVVFGWPHKVVTAFNKIYVCDCLGRIQVFETRL